MPIEFPWGVTGSTVAIPPNPAASGTSLTVAAGTGATFPAPPFDMLVWPAGAVPTGANSETVRVTAVAGDVLTVRRQAQNSLARSMVLGDSLIVTAPPRVIVTLPTDRRPAYDIYIPDSHGLIVSDEFEPAAGYEVELAADGILEII